MLTFACKAQSPIIDIDDRQTELIDGAYLKDVYNELDKFVGTWLYTNGSTSLKVVFQKKTQVFNDNWYEDLLVGEYKYVENGVEKINTLSNLNNLQDVYDHNLTGCLIIYKKGFPGCSNCEIGEKRVKIDFSDPSLNLEHLPEMYMGLRFLNELVPKMQIDFAGKGTSVLPEGANGEPSLPFGRYVLVKQ